MIGLDPETDADRLPVPSLIATDAEIRPESARGSPDADALARVVGGRVEALASADAAESDQDRDDSPTVVHGVAIPVDQPLVGQSGERSIYGADVLRAAVDALRGVHLIADHPAKPGIRDIVGEVTDARYIDGLGLGFAAEVDDPDVARLIERGRVDASPYLYRVLGDEQRDGATVVSEILAIRDLGVVGTGAGGDAVAIESGPLPGESVEALAAAFGISIENPADSNSIHNMTSQPSDPESRITDLEGQLSETRDERDALRAENTRMKRVFADGLAAHSPFSADAIADRFDFDELTEALESAGESAESVVGETVEPRSVGSPDAGTADALSADDATRLETLHRQIGLLDSRAPEHADALRAEAADLAGADEYDDAGMEALLADGDGGRD